MTTSELADRILSNDPDLQHLYLSSDAVTNNTGQELVQALTLNNNNTHLRHVYFRNFKLGPGSRGGELPLLLQAVSNLSNLQSLFFHCTEVPVSVLSHVLENTSGSQKLSALGLRYCILKYDNEQDCTAFEMALKHNTSLQDVCVEGCEWQVEHDEEGRHLFNNNSRSYSLTKMSAFLESISHIPTLRHVECVLTAASAGALSQQQQRLPASTLQSICRIPLLQTLRLRNVWLPQSDVALLCHELTTTSTTTSRVTPSQLQKLILSLDMGPTSALALSKLLQQQGTNLEHLALRIDRLLDPDSPQLLAQALRHSKLRHFHLSGGEQASLLSLRAKMAFRDMMQTNICLEFVRLDVADYALQSELAFYLQLNHKGRRQLFRKLQSLQQTTTPATTSSRSCTIINNKLPASAARVMEEEEDSSLWVQALCQNATDVRALHYFLALHPALFATAALEAHHAKQQQLEGNDAPRHHHDQSQQQQQQQQLMYEWDAEDGIVYDSDGW